MKHLFPIGPLLAMVLLPGAIGCSSESVEPQTTLDAGALAPPDADETGDLPRAETTPSVDGQEPADGLDTPNGLDPGDGQEATDGPGPGGDDEADVGSPETATPGDNPMFAQADGCVEPLDYVTPACEYVTCAGTTTCMGDGHCVPEAPFLAGDVDAGASQLKPTLALGGDGGFAAAWHTYIGGGTPVMRIYFQRFKPDGTAVGASVRLDDDSIPISRSPTITRMEEGGFLVVWREEAPDGVVRTMGHVLASDGQPGPGPFQLNTTPLGLSLAPGNVDSPFATLLRTGDLAVTWSADPADPQAQSDVYLRLLGPDGTPKGDELPTGGATTANETSSVVTDTWDGGVAIFWHEMGGAILEAVVRGRLFDQLGEPQGPVFTATPEDDVFEGLPAATTFPNGEMLLSWRVQHGSSSAEPMDVRTVLLDISGQPLDGMAQTVWTASSGYMPFYAPTAQAGEGRAVFAWHTSDSTVDGVFLRRYVHPGGLLDCDITDVAGPLSTGEDGGRHLPSVLGFPDGRILVAWASLFVDLGEGQAYRAVFRFVK